jgi:predicted HicB family RNase H-like nuclease
MALHTQKPPPIPDANVQAFVEQRGAKRRNVSHQDQIVLRLPQDLRQEIDTRLAARRPKVSRNQWILEAIAYYLRHQPAGEAHA